MFKTKFFRKRDASDVRDASDDGYAYKEREYVDTIVEVAFVDKSGKVSYIKIDTDPRVLRSQRAGSVYNALQLALPNIRFSLLFKDSDETDKGLSAYDPVTATDVRRRGGLVAFENFQVRYIWQTTREHDESKLKSGVLVIDRRFDQSEFTFFNQVNRQVQSMVAKSTEKYCFKWSFNGTDYFTWYRGFKGKQSLDHNLWVIAGFGILIVPCA